MRERYRYKGCFGNLMHWEGPMPGDSRVQVLTCDWDWFWSPDRRAGVGLAPEDPGAWRCPMRATDPITTRRPRDDGWRCGHEAGHAGSHTLYSAEGESVLYAGRWVHPAEIGLTENTTEKEN